MLTQRGDPNNDYSFNGLPAITSNITIKGNGAVIECDAAAPTFRLFAIASQDLTTGAALPTPGNLTLKDVWLRGGLAKGGNSGGRGTTDGYSVGAEQVWAVLFLIKAH